MTMLSSFGTGALPLAAVALGTSLVGRAGAGATLTVAVGLGSLAGSLVMTVFPLRGEPDQRARRHFAAVAGIGAGLGGAALLLAAAAAAAAGVLIAVIDRVVDRGFTGSARTVRRSDQPQPASVEPPVAG